MVDEIGLDKPKVDEIYYAILLVSQPRLSRESLGCETTIFHPNLISNSYEWKIGSFLLACCQPTFHGQDA